MPPKPKATDHDPNLREPGRDHLGDISIHEDLTDRLISSHTQHFLYSYFFFLESTRQQNFYSKIYTYRLTYLISQSNGKTSKLVLF